MIWEADNETCKNIEIGSKKILEISDGWHIESVYYPDNKGWKDFNYLGIVLERNTEETCEGCRYMEDKYGYDYCRKCSRNWVDRYEKSEDEQESFIALFFIGNYFPGSSTHTAAAP